MTGTMTETVMAEEAEEGAMNTITREGTVAGTQIGTGTMIHMAAGTGSETGTVVTIDLLLVIEMPLRNAKLMDHPRAVPKELMSMALEELNVTRSTRAVHQVTATEATMTRTASLPGDTKLQSILIPKRLLTSDVLLSPVHFSLQEWQGEGRLYTTSCI